MSDVPKLHRLAEAVLALLNRKAGWDDLIARVVRLVQETLGLEAVGLRLNDGDDYPYFVTEGFPAEFVRKENHLCAREKSGKLLTDAAGNPVIECMCGNVIRGRTDPVHPFFTPAGSFWTNGTTALLAGTDEADRQSRTRNRCNGEGYESVALIPIRSSGVTHGLLQLNDRREGMFTLPLIEFLEGLGGSIGLLFSMKRMEEELSCRKANIGRLVGVRTLQLARTAERLIEEIRRREEAPAEGDTLARLRTILDELKTLKGILPICCACKRIRNAENRWVNLETYISENSDADFSHGLCPDCYDATLQQLGGD